MHIIRNVQRKVMKITVTIVKVQSTMFHVLQKRNQMKMVLMETAQLMMPKMALLQNTRYNVHYKLCKNYPNLVCTGVKKWPEAKGLRIIFILVLILIYCSFLREFPHRNNSLF